jgi:hypothetical protein
LRGSAGYRLGEKNKGNGVNFLSGFEDR